MPKELNYHNRALHIDELPRLCRTDFTVSERMHPTGNEGSETAAN
jgi:hypothetical protein